MLWHSVCHFIYDNNVISVSVNLNFFNFLYYAIDLNNNGQFFYLPKVNFDFFFCVHCLIFTVYAAHYYTAKTVYVDHVDR